MKRSLRSWLWRVPIDQEVEEELAFHVEMRRREGKALSAEEVAQVRRACLDIARKRDREMKLTQWFSETVADVRFTLRQLKSSPGFTAVAVLTLALGVGANSAMFALADVTMFRPLPFAEPDRLVMVSESISAAPRVPVSSLNLQDIAQQSRSFEALAGVQLGAGGGPLVTAPDGSVQSAERQTVGTGFFDVLGVTPVAGRTFRAEDEGPTTSVVIFSESLWRSRFNGDRSLIGRQVRLNGVPFTLVGVLPDAVRFTRAAQMWTLQAQLPPQFNRREVRFLEAIGRLKPGVSVDAAQAELTSIAARLARDFPQENKGLGLQVEPLRNGMMGPDLQLTSMFLLGIVGFVLLMCCANVANLLLARGSARARELAVRTALGAGRARIVTQLLTESLVLAALGGGLGLVLGAAILRAAPSVIPPGLLPPVVQLSFDGRIVGFGALASLAVGVLFGLLPAWQATGRSLTGALTTESRSATAGGGRLRGMLVSGEVAAAVLLLCGAGLLLRTLLVLLSVDTGYRVPSDQVLTLDFSLPFGPTVPQRPNDEALFQFYDTIEREVSALPEVRRIGWSSGLPYGTTEFAPFSFEVVGDPPPAAGSRQVTEYAVASPGFFETLDLPVVMGRAFTERDTAGNQQVCIVSEAFVRRFLPGRNPIGLQLALRQGPQAAPVFREIVGVARQVSGPPAALEEPVQVYAPLKQHPTGDTYMVVQPSSGPAEALTPLVRAVVARHDPNTPVRRDRTLEFLSVQSTAGFRFRAAMAGTFAGLALVLAMVGVFGVLAYAVEQRRREFGVRIALGASTRNVLGLVMRSGGRMIALGALAGLLLAGLLARLMETFLFRVEPLDPVAFIAAAVVLLLTAAIATAVPAFRATRVDPVVAFRQD
jgi:putative ABC transport system permease protein